MDEEQKYMQFSTENDYEGKIAGRLAHESQVHG
jgi:hypothetical protein